nr:MAG TPA: hypothetical protein [Caudoviricetes sp.]
MAASGCLIFNVFTIPWSLTLPQLYFYNCLVIKAIKTFPHFKKFFLTGFPS